MKYLTLIPNYTGSCIQDDFEGQINLESLNLPHDFIEKLNVWHDSYKAIIPLNEQERKKISREIENLDDEGLQLAKTLKQLISGETKIKYFSEGRLAYLPIE